MRSLPKSAAKVVLFALAVAAPMSSRADEVRGSGWVQPALGADVPEEAKKLAEMADAAYADRHKPGNDQKALELIREASQKAPTSWDIQWRYARAAFWVAEGTTDSTAKGKLAQEGWEAGKRAQAAKPKNADALYWTALCIGQYSYSISIISALTQGIEPQFRDPLLEVEKLDPKMDHGGVYNALGRYKFELPWPKRDLKMSIEYLRKGIAVNPSDVRAMMYLAETLAKNDDTGELDEAKKLVKAVLDAVPGKYDKAEEIRVKNLTKDLVKRMGWEIQ